MASITTQKTIGQVLGLSAGAVCARLKGVPCRKGHWGTQLYDVIDVLPLLKPKERHRAADILATATETDDLWVGDGDAVARAQRLYGWMDDRMRARFEAAKVYFAEGLARSMESSAIIEHLPGLNWKLLLHSSITAYAVAHQKINLPSDWAQFSSAFAIVNAAHDHDLTNIEQEAA